MNAQANEYFTVIIDVFSLYGTHLCTQWHAHTHTHPHSHASPWMCVRIKNNGKRLQRTFSLDNFIFGVECFWFLIGFFHGTSTYIGANTRAHLAAFGWVRLSPEMLPVQFSVVERMSWRALRPTTDMCYRVWFRANSYRVNDLGAAQTLSTH